MSANLASMGEAMEMSVLASMAGFAVAASITPGPVNLVALASSVRFGFRAAMWHVSGATLGFVLLLLLVGHGLYALMERIPLLAVSTKWAGIVFLLYMACRLALDDGRLGSDGTVRRPSIWAGAVMQWLNPKAWLAAVAGVGVYCGEGDGLRLWQFAAIYLVVCYLSVASWAGAGLFLRQHLQDARRMRYFNRAMAVVIALSILALL